MKWGESEGVGAPPRGGAISPEGGHWPSGAGGTSGAGIVCGADSDAACVGSQQRPRATEGGGGAGSGERGEVGAGAAGQ